MLQIRDARLDDIPAIEEMVEDFVKGHPAQNQPRSAESRECFVSAKGFQVLAGLEGLPVREIVRRLPGPELSRQPPDP